MRVHIISVDGNATKICWDLYPYEKLHQCYHMRA
jgi:hypothetical protein